MYNENTFKHRPPSQAFSESVVTEYGFSLANELGTDPELVFSMILGGASGLLFGVGCSVTNKFKVSPAIFCVGGAPPSAGKTPIIERLQGHMNFLVDKYILLTDHEARKINIKRSAVEKRCVALQKRIEKVDDLESSSELIEELAKLQVTLEELVLPVTPCLSDCTPNSFVKEICLRNGVGINISAEGGILARFYSVKNELLKVYLSSWSAEEISDVSKKESWQCKRPCLSTAILWQDGPLVELLRNPKYRAIGLSARMLPYVTQQTHWPRSGSVSDECEKRFSELLERIFVSFKRQTKEKNQCYHFSLSTEAQSCLEEFRSFIPILSVQQNFLTNFPELAGKLDVHAIKLAMVLHVLNCSYDSTLEISSSTFRTACELALFFAEQSAMIQGNEEVRKSIAEATPVLKLLKSWAAINPGHPYEVKQIVAPLGIGKGKCLKILYWLAQCGAVSRAEKSVPCPDGKVRILEFWTPNILELERLLLY